MRDVRLDLTFPHEYEVKLEVELPSMPSGVKQIYYPGAEERGGRDGLVAKVIPYKGPPWIGTFASGYPKALTGVFSHPDKLSVCIVSSGRAYVVRVDDPQVWQDIRIFPIRDVRPIPEKKMLVFADFTKVAAYGKSGIIWTTSDLSWDGLKIMEATSNHVRGLAWDSPQGREVEFLVDIQTGQHEGGASPEMDVDA